MDVDALRMYWNLWSAAAASSTISSRESFLETSDDDDACSEVSLSPDMANDAMLPLLGTML
jgi:hypothetical protein